MINSHHTTKTLEVARSIIEEAGLTFEALSEEVEDESDLAAFGVHVQKLALETTKQLSPEDLGTIIGGATRRIDKVSEEDGNKVVHMSQISSFDHQIPDQFDAHDYDGLQLLQLLAMAEVVACIMNTLMEDYLRPLLEAAR